MLSVTVFVCLGWLISICLHEFGHAIAAYWGGDTSVKDKGYLTLNPLKYIDPLGSIILPVIFLCLGGIALPGAAVYIDRSKLRNRYCQSLVAGAGPLTNILLILFLTIPFRLTLHFIQTDRSGFWLSPQQYGWIWASLAFLIILQIYAVLINLLPIPPLDGYGIIEPWLPISLRTQIRKFAGLGMLGIFIIIFLIPPVNLFLLSLTFLIGDLIGIPSTLASYGAFFFHQNDLIWIIGLFIGTVIVINIVQKKIGIYDVWDILGFGLMKMDKNEKALFCFNQAIKLNPNRAGTWQNRGNILNKLKRYDEALISYERSLAIKPKSSVQDWLIKDTCNAWIGKGNVLANLERYEEAIAAQSQAIAVKPDAYKAWYNQGFVWHKLGRYTEAIASFEQAITLKPDYYEAWYNKGVGLSKLSQHEAALDAYEKVLSIQPSFLNALYNRAIELGCLERYEEAIAAYDQAIKSQPNNYNYWYNKALMLGNLSKYEEALKAYDKSIEIHPELVKAWQNRSQILMKMELYKEAIVCCEKALSIEPNNHSLWNNLGNALNKLDRYEEAIECYHKAIEIKPDYGNGWYNKACCYARQNLADLAIENLAQAIKIDPERLKAIAKTNADFDSLREMSAFQVLIGED